MKQEHDVYSYWLCFHILFGSNADLPAATMAEVLSHIEKDDFVEPDPSDIPELAISAE